MIEYLICKIVGVKLVVGVTCKLAHEKLNTAVNVPAETAEASPPKFNILLVTTVA